MDSREQRILQQAEYLVEIDASDEQMDACAGQYSDAQEQRLFLDHLQFMLDGGVTRPNYEVISRRMSYDYTQE